MSIMIMIDGSIKHECKFGFELQSLLVIEKCYKLLINPYYFIFIYYI